MLISLLGESSLKADNQLIIAAAKVAATASTADTEFEGESGGSFTIFAFCRVQADLLRSSLVTLLETAWSVESLYLQSVS